MNEPKGQNSKMYDISKFQRVKEVIDAAVKSEVDEERRQSLKAALSSHLEKKRA